MAYCSVHGTDNVADCQECNPEVELPKEPVKIRKLRIGKPKK